MRQPILGRRPRPAGAAPPDAAWRGALLERDLRLDVFAVLFALGSLQHETEFALEAWLTGPLSGYMERWHRVVESIGWPSSLATALHLGVVVVSLALLVVPRRELLCLLTGVFLPSQLASPHRISSHGGLMAACLSLILLLAMGEMWERVARRRWPGVVRSDWNAWTLVGLRWICTLTYFFAAVYKLNTGWLSPGSSPAARFVVPLAAPVLNALGSGPAAERLLVVLAIYGTLVVEFGLPLLLFRPSTRLLGCLVGVLFHLPMVARGVVDFPLLIIACYPCFLSLSETRGLLESLRRPTIARLAGTGLAGAYGRWAVSVMPKRWTYRPPAHPLVAVANNLQMWVAFVVLAYIALTLASGLRHRGGAFVSGAVATGDSSPLSARRDHDPRPAGRSRRVAVASVLAVVLGFVYLNVAGLVGLPAAGTMHMYSGLTPDRGNHLVTRSVGVTGAGQYGVLTDFDPNGVATPPAKEFGAFARWLRGPGQDRRVSLNFVRYHLARICRSQPAARIGVKLETSDGRTLAFDSVCDEPAMLRYGILLTPPPCQPSCDGLIRRWAKGDLPQE